MKKSILLLIFILILGLTACGDKPSGSNEHENTSAEENASNPDVLHLNETVVLGDFEITITGTDFLDQYTTSLDTLYYPAQDNVFLRVEYIIKNIGKTAHYTPLSMMKVEYGDGYVFDAFRSYIDSNLGFDREQGVENSRELKPLSNSMNGHIYFDVPNEVKNNSDEPLKVLIHPYYEDGSYVQETATYAIRPIDDKQKEAILQNAEELLKENQYVSIAFAKSRLEAIGETYGSSQLYDDIYLHYCLMNAGSKEEKRFLTDNIGTFELLSGDQISSLMIGDIKLSSYGTYWTFSEDGTIDDKYGNNRKWQVQNDKLVLSSDKYNDSYAVYKVYDGGYLLVNDDTESKTSIQSMFPQK